MRLLTSLGPLLLCLLLHIIDIALSQREDAAGFASTAIHVLIGLETQGLELLRCGSFEGTIPTLNDLRTSILAYSLDSDSDAHSKKTAAGLPSTVAAALEAGGDADAVRDALT